MHPGQDFLSKIMNILRDSTEGILSHAEVNPPDYHLSRSND